MVWRERHLGLPVVAVRVLLDQVVGFADDALNLKFALVPVSPSGTIGSTISSGLGRFFLPLPLALPSVVGPITDRVAPVPIDDCAVAFTDTAGLNAQQFGALHVRADPWRPGRAPGPGSL